MNLILARNTDAPEICDLLNLAYRSSEGWTNEHHLVGGHRVTLEQVLEAITCYETDFLIYKQGGKLVSCIKLDSSDGITHIGSFAVDPEFQGSGIGSRVIAAAEEFARKKRSTTKFLMDVLHPRQELMAYYERRGYQRTGRLSPFPVHENVGSPKLDNLMLEELEKVI